MVKLDEFGQRIEELHQQQESLMEARQVLEEERQRYQELFELAPDAYLVTDLAGTIREANRAAGDLFVLEQKFLVGKPLAVLVDAQDRREFRRRLAQLSMGEPVHDWTTRLKPRRELSTFIDVACRVAPVYREGELVGLHWLLRDVSALKRAERELRESEMKFKNLVEQTSDLIWEVDKHGRFSYVSPNVKPIGGYEAAEFIGKSPADFLSVAELERHQTWIDGYFKVRKPFVQIESRAVRKDGREIVLENSGKPIFDDEGGFKGYRGVTRDITERKRGDMALKESEERFRTIFQAAPFATCIATLEESRIVDVNARYERIFGYARAELVGRTIFEMNFWLEPERRRGLGETLKRFGYAYDVEFACRTRSGETRTMLGSYEVIELKGQKHVLVMFDDITERRRLEREVSEARYRLSESLEAERLRLAHELHDGTVQGLMALGYSLAGLKGHVAAEALAEVETIQGVVQKTVAELRGVIRNLRPAGLAEFGLFAALEGYATQLRRDGGESPRLELDLFGDDAELSESAAYCLFRVAQEALRNALKHAQAGYLGLELQICPKEAVLHVSDDGRGFTVPSPLLSLTREGHFGLAGMAERLAALGGELSIGSGRGAGTRVTARLPLEGV